jgi:hypothetical protein
VSSILMESVFVVKLMDVSQAVKLIEREFLPVIQMHLFCGEAIVKVSDSLCENASTLNMIIDVVTERGYDVSVQTITQHIPGSRGFLHILAHFFNANECRFR